MARPLRSLSRWIVAPIGLFVAGCSVVNDIDACDVEPREMRVNQRGDWNEAPTDPRAAVRLADGRYLVAYSASDDDEAMGEVRIVILRSDGTRTALCSSGDLEWVMNEPGTFAWGATAEAVNLENPSGVSVIAAVGWIEGIGNSSSVQMRFIDLSGCPAGIGGNFSPGFGLEGPTRGLSLAWSAKRRALLATYTDGRTIYASWLEGTMAASAAEVIASDVSTAGQTAAVVADDGRALVAWVAARDAGALSEFRYEVRAALLDSDGALLPAALAEGRAEPFTIEFPAEFSPSGSSIRVAVAARAGRFAIAADPAISINARAALYVREIDSDAGDVVGEARRVDPETGEGHGNPALAYMPDGSLLVAWESGLSGGTLARLFDSDQSARFNSISCDPQRFAVGERSRAQVTGTPSIVSSDDQLWIVHNAQPQYDSHGVGIVAWSLPFEKLWPAR